MIMANKIYSHVFKKFFFKLHKHTCWEGRQALGGIQIMLSHRQTLLLNIFKMLGNKFFLSFLLKCKKTKCLAGIKTSAVKKS